MNERGIKKLYYSIREVSELTSVKPYVLRHWESEFEELRPSKNRAGNRTYRLHDIKLVLLLKKLLYVEKFTFEGARQKLRMLKRPAESQRQLSFERLLQEDMVNEIKKELSTILHLLNNSNHH